MRKELQELEGERDLFIGRISREGSRRAYKGKLLPTILLQDVRRVSDNKLMCDHLWLNKTKAFSSIDLVEGQKIQFAARVKEYQKGYLGRRRDFKREVEQDFRLSHPTQVKLLESSEKKERREESRLIIRKKKDLS